MDENLSFFAVGRPSSLNSPGGSSDSATQQLDEHGNPARKRQQHRKSRKGCGNCKRRKVKCDEALPSCRNCLKRKLECQFSLPPEGAPPRRGIVEIHAAAQDFHGCGTASEYSTVTWPATGGEDGQRNFEIDEPEIISSVELILKRSPADRELIHRFERFTSKVLAMSQTIWSTEVLTLALRDDYLMSAILLIGAAHINHYLPKKHPNRRPILHHFGSAISGLRKDIANGISATNFDSVISCSLLLIHYSWTYIESDLRDDHDIAFLFRDTFALFHGLKECVMTVHNLFIRKSKWSKVLLYKPRVALERYVQGSRSERNKWEDAFHHCLFCEDETNCTDGASADNMSAATRLILLLQAIDLSSPDILASGVSAEIFRYLFTWPTLCTNGFIQQVRENNPTSMKVLFYYYAAIGGVYCDQIWWMRDRAKFMYNLLRLKLEGGCDECIRPAIALVESRKSTSWSWE